MSGRRHAIVLCNVFTDPQNNVTSIISWDGVLCHEVVFYEQCSTHLSTSGWEGFRFTTSAWLPNILTGSQVEGHLQKCENTERGFPAWPCSGSPISRFLCIDFQIFYFTGLWSSLLYALIFMVCSVVIAQLRFFFPHPVLVLVIFQINPEQLLFTQFLIGFGLTPT